MTRKDQKRNLHSRKSRSRGTPDRHLRQHTQRNSRYPLRASKHQQDTLAAVAHVITTMRHQRVSLTHALKGSGLSRRTVLRLAAPALEKSPNGWYAVKRSDRLPRVVRVPDERGTRDVVVRSSRDASRIGRYWNAVHKYLSTGDASDLQSFARVRITDANGAPLTLITDRRMLDRIGAAGVLSFESIYARTA